MKKPIFLLDNIYAEVVDGNNEINDAIKEVCTFTHTDFMYRWICRKCNSAVKWVNKKPFCTTCNQYCNFNGLTKKNRPSFVELCYFKNGQFPTGLFRRVTNKLLTDNIKFNWSDIREKPKKKSLWAAVLPKLRYYQTDAGNIMIKKTRGIASMPTRSGKTYVIMDIIRRLGLQSLVIVPNLTLLHQTYEMFKKYFNSDFIGIVGDSIFTPNRITVATIQTLNSRFGTPEVQKLISDVNCLIIDEAHHINFSTKNGEVSEYNTWMNICMNINAYYRFGFTATPGKQNDLDRALLEATTGSIQYEISLEMLVKEEYILQPKVLVHKFNHKELKYIDNKKEAHFEWKDWQQADKLGIVNNRERCEFITKIANDYTKEGKTLLISVDKIKHANLIQQCLQGSYYLDGKSSSTERAKVLKEFENTKGAILVTTLFKEGVTIIFNGILLATSFSKERKVMQTCGRVLNIAGGTGEIIDIHDVDGSTLEKRYKLRKRVYKKEKFEIKDVK